MSAIDVEAILAPLSPDAPCGEDLQYDSAYNELESLVQGTPEVQIGEKIVAATEPDWRKVNDQCSKLLTRTKDLRVAMYLTLAMLKQRGPAGLADGLALVRGLLERYWEPVYPRLDPDDPDPIERVNVIASLARTGFGDPMRFDQRLREAPLTNSRKWGRFSLRDVLIAKGEITAPEEPGKPKPQVGVIDQAFADTPLDELRASSEAIGQARAHVQAIDAALTERAGVRAGVDMTAFIKTLTAIGTQLAAPLAKRGVNVGSAGGAAGGASDAAGSGAAGDGAAHSGGTAMSGGSSHAEAPASSGEIRSKADVVLALERICQYYERTEPSSPIPMLLKGAQRLVTMNFMEIMKCLTPDVFKNLLELSGLDRDQG